MKPSYLAELTGTFCLVFAGTAAAVGQAGVVGVGLVFGLIVLAMIYAVGPVSGAHLNPAVTLAFAAQGRLGRAEIAPYIASQLAGAALGSAAVAAVFGTAHSLGATLPSGSWQQSFLLEFLLSFILMFVIMAVSTAGREEGLMAGVAVGSVVALEAILGGPVSGASMNPARSFGPALLTGDFAHHWLYWAAPILGALAGAWTQRRVQA